MTSEEMREQREARGWSRARLAREAGLAPCTVGQIEAGSPPSSRSRRAIARALGQIPLPPRAAADGARLIELEDGALVALDAADFERFAAHLWHRFKGMAARREGQGPRRVYRFLHRQILEVDDPLTEVWFRDRDPLNCRRANLFIPDRPGGFTELRRRQRDHRLTRQLYARWDISARS